MAESWASRGHIKLGVFRKRCAAIPGSRIVLLRKGIPSKVIPRSGVSIELGLWDRWVHGDSVAVSDAFTPTFEFDSYLFTSDRVEVVCMISVTIKTKQDDESVLHIAAAPDVLLTTLREKLFVSLQRKLRSMDYEGAVHEGAAIEESLMADAFTEGEREAMPYQCGSVSVIQLKSKDDKILTEREKALIVRAATLSHQIQLNQKELDFEAKKKTAAHEQELRHIPKRASLEVQAEEEDSRIDVVRKYAAINNKYGSSALPAKWQYDLLRTKAQVLASAASTDPEMHKKIIDVVVKAASADRDKSYLDLLNYLPGYDGPEEHETTDPELEKTVSAEPSAEDMEKTPEGEQAPKRESDATASSL